MTKTSGWYLGYPYSEGQTHGKIPSPDTKPGFLGGDYDIWIYYGEEIHVTIESWIISFLGVLLFFLHTIFCLISDVSVSVVATGS